MARKRSILLAVATLIPQEAALAEGATAAAPPPAIIIIGASYVAKQLCSCVFVAGRAEGPCRTEFKPQIDPFTVTVASGPAPKVTVSLGPVTSEADFAPPFGCGLVR